MLVKISQRAFDATLIKSKQEMPGSTLNVDQFSYPVCAEACIDPHHVHHSAAGQSGLMLNPQALKTP